VPTLSRPRRGGLAGNKLAEVPDFYQQDPRGGFVGDGSNYCYPVAASNSLLYFARHGYPNLLADPNKPDADEEIDLIHTLYSPAYFGTDPGNGTAPTTVLRSLPVCLRRRRVGKLCKLTRAENPIRI
jgi:hypothetical protein